MTSVHTMAAQEAPTDPRTANTTLQDAALKIAADFIANSFDEAPSDDPHPTWLAEYGLICARLAASGQPSRGSAGDDHERLGQLEALSGETPAMTERGNHTRALLLTMAGSLAGEPPIASPEPVVSEGLKLMDDACEAAAPLVDYDVALARFQRAKAISDALDDSEATSGDRMVCDLATDAYCEAMDDFIERTRAPSCDALLFKMGLMDERCSHIGLFDEYWTALRADITHLASLRVLGPST